MPERVATPSQTVGPFYAYGLIRDDDAILAGPEARGERVRLSGALRDHAGAPVRDALIELWQADAAGRYAGHDADADPGFRGFGRTLTGPDGGFRFETVVPGACRGAGNALQAPHFDLGVFAAGLTRRATTRVYLPETAELAADSVLAELPEEARPRLLASRGAADGGVASLTFEIRLGGETPTPMFKD